MFCIVHIQKEKQEYLGRSQHPLPLFLACLLWERCSGGLSALSQAYADDLSWDISNAPQYFWPRCTHHPQLLRDGECSRSSPPASPYPAHWILVSPAHLFTVPCRGLPLLSDSVILLRCILKKDRGLRWRQRESPQIPQLFPTLSTDRTVLQSQATSWYCSTLSN